jgi:hypothetical protein
MGFIEVSHNCVVRQPTGAALAQGTSPPISSLLIPFMRAPVRNRDRKNKNLEIDVDLRISQCPGGIKQTGVSFVFIKMN